MSDVHVMAGSVTGLVLAGGRGSRMGGADKGLQPFRGLPLAAHALQRLYAQAGSRLDGCAINANRHLAAYEAMGVPVWTDVVSDHPGPLAGFLTGLRLCPTPYLLTVPCDAPLYPLDLLERLATALEAQQADLALAAGPDLEADPTGQTHRPQPVFCLMSVGLHDSLTQYLEAGERKITTWMARHRVALVPFDHPQDDPRAFANANTLAELRALERDA